MIDKRFSGIAKGLGTASIIGRVHSAQIKVGPLFLACSFTIIEGKDIDILFGLDMLRSHQACIDLKRNALVINDALIPFLSEADLPDNAKMETIYLPEAVNHDKEQAKADNTQKQSGSRDNSSVLSQSTYKGQSGSKYQEEDIRQLQALGFSKEEALQALEAADGDVSMAANFLF